ncbi:hypothetical protein ABZ651_33230, partial [Streptomyces sp. NPDC007070]
REELMHEVWGWEFGDLSAAGTALGLAAVTGACRVLLRQSERGAARLRAEERVPHRGRRRRTGTGAHRGHRHPGGTTPAD